MSASLRYTASRVQVIETRHEPVRITGGPGDGLLVDFGLAMFGTLSFTATSDKPMTITVHLGEKLNDRGLVDRTPPGNVRHRAVQQAIRPGTHDYRLVIPSDAFNTKPPFSIHMQENIGEVLPYRYAEIHTQGVRVEVDTLRMIAAHVPFDDTAAHFVCDDDTLNAVWALCKHSIKATSFLGIYVDGDRERIPYEGDAYINQLCHYCADAGVSYQIARHTHEYLIQNPTWFADWMMHNVLMAWADYEYTGQTDSIRLFFDDLQAKTLIDLAREDGLICTTGPGRTPDLDKRTHVAQDRYAGVKNMYLDLVDWPPGSFALDGQGERDGHEMLPVNSVVNALHYQTLVLMANMARVVDRLDVAERFDAQAQKVHASFNRVFFDEARGVYIDGEGSTHASVHSNMFPLAFGLVPQDRIAGVKAFVKSRGMACSVYGAQYLLEGLYNVGESAHALSLMNARHDRSWYHMIEQGSTVTLEAWALKYKKNLDWNHAWGAVPGNIIPRRLMGVTPGLPGFARVRIAPQPASLKYAFLRTPTPRGPVELVWERSENGTALQVTTPQGMPVELDRAGIGDATVTVNGQVHA